MSSSGLPERTLKHLKQQHPEHERFEEFVSTCLLSPRVALRVNTNKISVSDFQRLAESHHWDLTPIPWTKEGFWITHPQDNALGNHVYHLAGLFYLQESTSMLPVAALFHNHNPTTLLDMAAAPGSKTTQLQNHLQDGYILANDMSSSRVKMLNANLIRCGVSRYGLLHQDGRKLTASLPAVFDGILLDAPCGGEGTIRKDPKAWDNWSVESLKSLSDLQKALIGTAWQLLAPGGRLIYSTCSLSREENHDVVQHLLNEIGASGSLVDLSGLFPEANQVCDNGMLHIWPEVFNTEGFFVAAIEKSTATEQPVPHVSSKTQNKPSTKLTEFVCNYLQERFGYQLSPAHMYVSQSGNKQTVWLKEDIPPSLLGVRTQRSGIKICELYESRKGMGINLDHEFCRSHGQYFTLSQQELTSQQAVDYFQGKNISVETSITVGEVLLTLAGQPIGLGKLLNSGTIKNQLPRNLVHDNAWA